MIRFTCECGRQLQARDQDAGKMARCPACQTVVPVPDDTEEEPTRRDAVQDAPSPNRSRAADYDDEDEDDDRDRRPRRRRRRDAPAGSSGKATAALIFGIASFCLTPLALPGIILGALALHDISKSKGRLEGKGLAIAGLVMSCLTLFLTVALLALFLPAVSKVREAAGRLQDGNNLKQIGLAMHNFHSTRNRFPQAAAFRTKDGQPGLSWRVALLPYLEEDGLYRQFKLDEPWDSPTNRPLLARIPKIYLQPDQAGDTSGITHYLVFTGQEAMFDDPLKPNPKGPPVPAGQPEAGVGLRDVTDGSANTVLVVTAPNGVPWTKPDDLAYNPGAPLPPLVAPGRRGFNALFVDGSVRLIAPNTAEPTLRGMITRNGGEVIALP